MKVGDTVLGEFTYIISYQNYKHLLLSSLIWCARIILSLSRAQNFGRGWLSRPAWTYPGMIGWELPTALVRQTCRHNGVVHSLILTFPLNEAENSNPSYSCPPSIIYFDQSRLTSIGRVKMSRRRAFEGDEATLSYHQKRPCSGLIAHDRYTVAWICALPIEMAAARAMLDQEHRSDIKDSLRHGLRNDPLLRGDSRNEPLVGDHPLPINEHEHLSRVDDGNSYVLGTIQGQNVVLACLPIEEYGTNNAAIVMSNLKRTFTKISICLMVGIGGGVPTKADIRLGDIVVGTRVMQSDLGKTVDGKLQRTALPRIPGSNIRTVISNLRSRHELEGSHVAMILKNKMQKYPAFGLPNEPDRLFKSSYSHPVDASTCEECDESRIEKRKNRSSTDPFIHYGGIASGNQVMKDATSRDNIATELDIICFEMEAAGIMNVEPCLPIRGICDYSDSHKAKEWQRYAAATAAAYAYELLEVRGQHTRDVESVHILSTGEYLMVCRHT